MSAKWLRLVAVAVLLAQTRVDAKQNNDDSKIRVGQSSSEQATTGLARVNNDANTDKAPAVVVDLGDIDVSDITSKKINPTVEPSAKTKSFDTDFGSGPSVVDPLDSPIANSTEASTSWISGTGIERWTRHPVGAAAISIGLVLFGYSLMRMMGGRSTSRRPGRLPRQVIELVGFVPLSPRQQLQLVRLGSKLVLVAVSANGTEPLAEVTDPVEVDQILTACQSGQSALASAIGRWSGRQSPREYTQGGERRARALFEA